MGAKTSHPDRNATQKLIERRWSARLYRAGEVVLISDEDPFLEIRGVLCDLSEDGFRAAHQGVRLGAGQQVHFTHPFAQGVATLMWTRVVGKKVESGFLVSKTEGKP